MKTVSLGASRPSAVSFHTYDPCPLSFSVNKQSSSVPLGDRLEEPVAAHPLACAWLPPCFSGRRGTTWCRYAYYRDASTLEPARSRLRDHQLRQEDGQGPQAAGHIRPLDAPVHPRAIGRVPLLRGPGDAAQGEDCASQD